MPTAQPAQNLSHGLNLVGSLNEIAAFLTAVSHATNIAKALINARDEVKRTGIAIEFNAALLDVQAKQVAVIEKNQSLLAANEALNKKLAEYDRWEQEKTRYTLLNVGAGVFVYALNQDQKAGEPQHWLCTNCYQGGNKSILQAASLNLYRCPRCNKVEIEATKALR